MLPGELNGSVHFGDEFGKGTLCVCKEGNQHDAGLTCGHCTRDKDLISGVMVADKRDGVLTTKMTPEEIQRRLLPPSFSNRSWAGETFGSNLA
jgi:hypothetical protein